MTFIECISCEVMFVDYQLNESMNSEVMFFDYQIDESINSEMMFLDCPHSDSQCTAPL